MAARWSHLFKSGKPEEISVDVVPTAALESPVVYEEFWKATRAEFARWKLRYRKIPKWTSLLRESFVTLKEDGERFTARPDYDLLFGKTSDYSPVYRYLRADPDNPEKPMHYALDLARVQHLVALADVLRKIRAINERKPDGPGAAGVQQSL